MNALWLRIIKKPVVNESTSSRDPGLRLDQSLIFEKYKSQITTHTQINGTHSYSCRDERWAAACEKNPVLLSTLKIRNEPGRLPLGPLLLKTIAHEKDKVMCTGASKY